MRGSGGVARTNALRLCYPIGAEKQRPALWGGGGPRGGRTDLMNIIRTIPQYETQRWVDLLFQPGPPNGPKDPDPLTYPMSRRLSQDVAGGFLYVVYQGKLIGYARIARVESHDGDTVGEEDQAIAAGDRVVLETPLIPTPLPVACRGFRGYRYISTNLHEVSTEVAEAAIAGQEQE